MCGIFGLVHPGAAMPGAVLEAALHSLRHRGPDDHGTWEDPEQGVTLAQTRLAILDLSPAGHQPMVSPSGRYVISFNGEIYNHQDLRELLRPAATEGGQSSPSWRGHSDTETLLVAIEQWGMEATLQKASGMFAFCLWDRQTQEMHLARDRVGEKPLYYGYAGGAFAVASEARAFRILPGFTGTIDRTALGLMMRFLAVPAPHCIYEGFASLPPGCWLSIGLAGVRGREMPAPRTYWSAAAHAEQAGASRSNFGSDSEAIDALQACLGGAVRRQMISDVPLGAFLSGGIDSSLIVAMMQAEASRRGSNAVKTFSIGYERADYDEAPFARQVARHLGTAHTEHYVSEADCLALVPRLAANYDEPFADSSQVGVLMVSRMARESVTVALSGDGGDELFGGYNRYVQAADWWRRSRQVPRPLRAAMSAIATCIPADSADRVALGLSRLLPASMEIRRPGDRIAKLGRILGARDAQQLYTGLAEHWRVQDILLDPQHAATPIDGVWPELGTLEEQLMLLDLSFILPTDMLVKVDRAAMSVSLETRVPFLDPEVMQFAWRLPLQSKIRGGDGKWILKQLLKRHLPAALVDRPKRGFNTPVAQWLRGPLRDWAEALIDPERLRREGLFQPAAIRRCWVEHLRGTKDHADRLWAVLMFQSWHEQNQPVTARLEQPRTWPTSAAGFDSAQLAANA